MQNDTTSVIQKVKRVSAAKIRPLTELHELPDTAFMTTAEAGLYSVLTVAALRIRRSTGNGPKFYKNASTIRYRKADIDQWLSGVVNTEAA